jgi:nuclear pore complex protein Nup98-Nup96
LLDYAHIMTRLPELQLNLDDPNAVPDATQSSELDDLARSIPRLIDILPDVFRNRDDPRHNAALTEVTAGLISMLDKIKPLALVRDDSADSPPIFVLIVLNYSLMHK